MEPGNKEKQLFKTVFKVIDNLNYPNNSLTSTAETCASTLMKYAGADSCIIVLLQQRGMISNTFGWTVEGDKIKNPSEHLSHFLIRCVEHSKQIVFEEDARGDRRWRSQEDQRLGRHIRSLLGIPVIIQNKLAAIFSLSNETVPLLYEKEEELLLVLVQLFGVMLEKEKQKQLQKKDKKTLEAPQPGTQKKMRMLSQPVFSWHGFLSRSKKMKDVFDSVEKIARTDIPVLIVGEDGTGKDMLARAIHELSGCSGHFVTVSCSTIPESLAESEIFGYKKGAFTGAFVDKSGLIAQAEEGTLFLDDLQEIKKPLQALLLRALAEGTIRPLGSDKPVKATFRLIASTTMQPRELMDRGLVRDDFLYRIKGAVFNMPPLRERPEDIRLLFNHFYCEDAESVQIHLNEEAERSLILYSWPGNIRELRNEARRLKAMGKREIDSQQFSFVVTGKRSEAESGSSFVPLKEAVKRTEEKCVKKALAIAEGNKSKAAKLLGITRRSLYRRLEAFEPEEQ